MAATISVKEVNGSGAGTPTTVTAIRFCTADNYNPGTSYPLIKPSTGTNYSYVKWLYLNADTSPGTIINNIKFFTDGDIGWTGITVYGGISDTYTQSTGTEGTTGTHDTALTTDISDYTSASPLDFTTDHIDNPATGKITRYLKLQADITNAAPGGVTASETLYFQYDEI